MRHIFIDTMPQHITRDSREPPRSAAMPQAKYLLPDISAHIACCTSILALISLPARHRFDTSRLLGSSCSIGGLPASSAFALMRCMLLPFALYAFAGKTLLLRQCICLYKFIITLISPSPLIGSCKIAGPPAR